MFAVPDSIYTLLQVEVEEVNVSNVSGPATLNAFRTLLPQVVEIDEAIAFDNIARIPTLPQVEVEEGNVFTIPDSIGTLLQVEVKRRM